MVSPDTARVLSTSSIAKSSRSSTTRSPKGKASVAGYNESKYMVGTSAEVEDAGKVVTAAMKQPQDADVERDAGEPTPGHPSLADCKTGAVERGSFGKPPKAPRSDVKLDQTSAMKTTTQMPRRPPPAGGNSNSSIAERRHFSSSASLHVDTTHASAESSDQSCRNPGAENMAAPFPSQKASPVGTPSPVSKKHGRRGNALRGIIGMKKRGGNNKRSVGPLSARRRMGSGRVLPINSSLHESLASLGTMDSPKSGRKGIGAMSAISGSLARLSDSTARRTSTRSDKTSHGDSRSTIRTRRTALTRMDYDSETGEILLTDSEDYSEGSGRDDTPDPPANGANFGISEIPKLLRLRHWSSMIRLPVQTEVAKYFLKHFFFLVCLYIGTSLPLLFFHDEIKAFFKIDNESLSEISVRNDTLSAYLSVMGIVHAVVFGFIFQLGVERLKSIKVSIYTEASSLHKILLLVQCTSTDDEDYVTKPEIYKKILHYLHQVMHQEMKFGVKLCRNVHLYEMIPLLREIAAGSEEDEIDHLIIHAVLEELREVDNSRRTRVALSESKLPWPLWICIEIQAFLTFMGILLLDSSSDRLNTTLYLFSFTSVIILSLLVADFDSPFEGLFKVNTSALSEVKIFTERMIRTILYNAQQHEHEQPMYDHYDGYGMDENGEVDPEWQQRQEEYMRVVAQNAGQGEYVTFPGIMLDEASPGNMNAKDAMAQRYASLGDQSDISQKSAVSGKSTQRMGENGRRPSLDVPGSPVDLSPQRCIGQQEAMDEEAQRSAMTSTSTVAMRSSLESVVSHASGQGGKVAKHPGTDPPVLKQHSSVSSNMSGTSQRSSGSSKQLVPPKTQFTPTQGAPYPQGYQGPGANSNTGGAPGNSNAPMNPAMAGGAMNQNTLMATGAYGSGGNWMMRGFPQVAQQGLMKGRQRRGSVQVGHDGSPVAEPGMLSPAQYNLARRRMTIDMSNALMSGQCPPGLASQGTSPIFQMNTSPNGSCNNSPMVPGRLGGRERKFLHQESIFNLDDKAVEFRLQYGKQNDGERENEEASTSEKVVIGASGEPRRRSRLKSIVGDFLGKLRKDHTLLSQTSSSSHTANQLENAGVGITPSPQFRSNTLDSKPSKDGTTTSESDSTLQDKLNTSTTETADTESDAMTNSIELTPMAAPTKSDPLEDPSSPSTSPKPKKSTRIQAAPSKSRRRKLISMNATLQKEKERSMRHIYGVDGAAASSGYDVTSPHHRRSNHPETEADDGATVSGQIGGFESAETEDAVRGDVVRENASISDGEDSDAYSP